MKKLLILLLFPFSVSGQITYFGTAANPSDNGTSVATTVAVTPPGSMTTGDLVILTAYQRGTATFSISATGGQSWTSETRHQGTTATLSMQVFWCRYNGTWGADPSILFSAGTNTNVVMNVFRPTSSSYSWAKDPYSSAGADNNVISSYAATTSVALIVGTPQNNNTVTLGIFSSDDDNTWSFFVGTGWVAVTSPAAQFRNTSGSDISSAYAYIIQTSGAADLANPQMNQATLGADGGIKGSYTFYEYIPSSLPHRIKIISK